MLETPFESAGDFDPEPIDPGPIEDEGGRRRSPFRLGTTSIWILLAVIGSLYRVCSGG